MARPRTTSDEAILRAAGRAIGGHGPAGLTLAAVATEAGLSPAALVQRFGSKRGLLLAFAEWSASGTGEVFGRARRRHDSPLTALYEALTELASTMGTPEEAANALAFLQLDLTDPEFREHAVTQARRMREEITGLLAEAVVTGELTGNADPVRLARAVQVAYNGTLILWALTGEGDLPRVLRADIDHLLRVHRPDVPDAPDHNDDTPRRPTA
ncbi:TetR/AcrR family transcriptional regulator [Streptosporangium sp. NPDC023615]|uniref:TetR/AcrR family transcriptional regulator n=1 Tax=Streptosporangium sp. NPDC023615 TaxID=3154794 RepID=UPI00342DA756